MRENCTNCKHRLLDDTDTPCKTCVHLEGRIPSNWEVPERITPDSPEVAAGREKGNLLHYPDSRHGDVISLCLNGDIGFCEGNIIKYVTRWRKKGGLEDLQKAKVYLDRLIRFNRNKDPQ